MVFEIVSREQELASVREFLGRTEPGPAALVLEGSAGIGKSTIWLDGVEHARALGFRVLESRPAEAEQSLAHVGLGDLFEEVLDEVLPALSPPRRRALEVALLVEDAAEEAVDPRALGTATRSAIQLLAERAPLLLAIDDVQWLDASSAFALAFALRRLGSGRVLLLLAHRSDSSAEPTALERALGAESTERLTVGPLSVGGLHRLLRDRLRRPFARQTLLRIHERSGGNPFFALELARVVDADLDPAAPLAVPGTLDELLRARISGLPGPTREALALASALGTVLGVPARAGRRGAGGTRPGCGGGGDRARRARRSASRTRSSRRSSTGIWALPGWRCTRASRAIVEDPLLRACHLALSTDTPDAAVARELDSAATARRGSRRVRRRGRARRAGAAADAAELPARIVSGALWPQLVHTTRRVNGRGRGRSRPTCWPTPRSGRCGPRPSSSLPSSRASIVRSPCSRRLSRRQARARRFSRSSSAALRGRRASGRATCGRSSTREWRSRSPTGSTTTSFGRAPRRWRQSSAGWSATRRRRRFHLGRTTSRRRSAERNWCRRQRSPS